MERMAISAITWKDAQLAPDDGRLYEAIGGNLYVTAAPTRRHQEVSRNLLAALLRLIQEPTRGYVYTAPIGVEFEATGEGVQPDIIVIARERRAILFDDWIHGAPDLVVEILSPSTAGRDRNLKRNLYQRQGVVDYWIVDAVGESVEWCDFSADPPVSSVHRTELPVRLAGSALGALDLAEVFASDI